MRIMPVSGGGGSAGTTINQASGENDGPGLGLMAAVAAGAYVVYKVVM